MKGIALNELAYLIIAIILVSILLVIFFLFQFPFMVFPIVLFDHLSTFVRGFVIAGIWTAFLVFVGLFSAVIWISMANPECWGPQAIGCAAKNAIMTAIFIGILTGLAFYFTSQIPLAYKSIQLKESNVTVDKNLADWVVDTSYMANAGINDPFRGTATNPRISFIITIKKGNVDLYHALERLNWPTYSIYDKLTGKVWDDGMVMKNSWWHVKNFGIDIKIHKVSSNWYVNIENSSNKIQCEFNETAPGHPWSYNWSFPWNLTLENGEIVPQQNIFNCSDGNKYKIFVSKSELNPSRVHVTIGRFSLKYEKLKNVVVKIGSSSPKNIVYNEYETHWVWVPSPTATFIPVLTMEKKFNINGLKGIKLKKGTVIFLDYLDTCDFCGYSADECGGDIDNPKEGVYICIPNTGG